MHCYLLHSCSGALFWNIQFVVFYGAAKLFDFFFQVPYIETSAKSPPVNVDLAFHDLVRVIK